VRAHGCAACSPCRNLSELSLKSSK
jgi:hypothetical protein